MICNGCWGKAYLDLTLYPRLSLNLGWITGRTTIPDSIYSFAWAQNHFYSFPNFSFSSDIWQFLLCGFMLSYVLQIFGHILSRSSLLSGMAGRFPCVCSLSLTRGLSGFLRIPNLVSLINWASGSDRKMLPATLLWLTMVVWVVLNLPGLLFIEVRQGIPLPRCVFQKMFNNSSRNSERVKG